VGSELHEDLAESTVASVFAKFSTIMNVIVRSHLIPANPCYGIRVTSDAYDSEKLVASPMQGLRAAMRLYEWWIRTVLDGLVHRGSDPLADVRKRNRHFIAS
jgi:hypothetical protein